MIATSVGTAYARTGLLGNPSDGYEGKALACPVRDFAAAVSVAPSERFSISAGGAAIEFPDLRAAIESDQPLLADGLEMLILAATRRLAGSIDAALLRTAPIEITCSTLVPRQVGLAGSSAAIIATMRALAAHWEVTVTPFDLAEMALATEVVDLGIAAGPMDRVIQAYERVMVLDLAPPRSEASYRRLDPSLLPPLLIAWTPTAGRPSGVTHSDLRQRWEHGDEEVVATMRALRGIVDRGVVALEAADHDAFADLVDANFELRCGVTSVGEADREMVAIARSRGAAAKLCGSGGAVVVVPRQGVELGEVGGDLDAAGFRTCRPTVV